MHPILISSIPPLSLMPGGMIFDSQLSIVGQVNQQIKQFGEGIIIIDNLLHPQTVSDLLSIFRNAPLKEEVSALGLKEKDGPYKGSKRVSLWAPETSDSLFKLLLPFISEREFNEFSRTDFWQDPFSYRWKPIGLSPLLRMMSYPTGAEHLPHYDAAYFYPDARFRSLMSVIFYLSTHEKDGSTRILKDCQDHIPERERIHEDRNERANGNEVLLKVQPKAGSVFLFDHRYYHDAETAEEERILIRTDLVFEKM